jgi:hypothetical protein
VVTSKTSARRRITSADGVILPFSYRLIWAASPPVVSNGGPRRGLTSVRKRSILDTRVGGRAPTLDSGPL